MTYHKPRIQAKHLKNETKNNVVFLCFLSLGPRLWGAFQVCELQYLHIIYKSVATLFNAYFSLITRCSHRTSVLPKRLQPSSSSVLFASYCWWGQLNSFDSSWRFLTGHCQPLLHPIQTPPRTSWKRSQLAAGKSFEAHGNTWCKIRKMSLEPLGTVCRPGSQAARRIETAKVWILAAIYIYIYVTC